jgi:hypothetical protein
MMPELPNPMQQSVNDYQNLAVFVILIFVAGLDQGAKNTAVTID